MKMADLARRMRKQDPSEITQTQIDDFLELFEDPEQGFSACCNAVECSPQAMYGRLKTKAHRDAWQRARLVRASASADQAHALASMAATPDGAPYARGIEVAVKQRQWEAERQAPELYGTRTQHDHSHTVDYAAALDAAASRVRRLHREQPPAIEHDPAADLL